MTWSDFQCALLPYDFRSLKVKPPHFLMDLVTILKKLILNQDLMKKRLHLHLIYLLITYSLPLDGIDSFFFTGSHLIFVFRYFPFQTVCAVFTILNPFYVVLFTFQL